MRLRKPTTCCVSLLGLIAVVHGGYAALPGPGCPQPCRLTGANPSNWTVLHAWGHLETCPGTILFDMNVRDTVESSLTIRACTTAGKDGLDDDDDDDELVGAAKTGPESSLDLTADDSCGAKVVDAYVVPAVNGFGPTNNKKLHKKDAPLPHADDVLTTLARYAQRTSQCGANILFAKSSSVLVGLYAGSQIAKSAVPTLINTFRESSDLKGQRYSFLQVCGESQTSLPLTFGLYLSDGQSIDEAHEAVSTWSQGRCLAKGSTNTLERTNISVLVSTADSGTASAKERRRGIIGGSVTPQVIEARGDCKAIQVKSGDGCASLASRCHISGSDLTKYNKQANFCATLKPNQYICCSAGTLPDFRPQPGKDGTCFTYSIGKSDTCFDIADAHSLKSTDIDGVNKKTWGWSGCARLGIGQKICLSKGDPPMPAPVNGVTCGPQVPGTKKPASGTSLASLNPCPLNACCDVFGFCGTTAEFCTATPSDTGAPGTAKPGTNGCISNCGTKVVRNTKAPATFKKIGYYEAFNTQRSCLNMDVSSIDASQYTHIHYAFATITSDFSVNISDSKMQFGLFTKLKGVKKVLSFGGWAFSTDTATFQRFRQATDSAHRGAFVTKLVDFMNKNALDGFDFDWEYPGAPDIPDITPGSPQEGQNYLDFLTLLRKSLPASKSLSIALPASFWYLKQYPVAKMASQVDYFIYMTYDLHGQWDVGNKWAIPSCSSGNCLRSHVNKTETYNALAMVTKAGVDSTKLVVGVTSYGRGFRMSKASCSGPLCTYTGGKGGSQAYPGRCTGTPGYISNAEINEVIAYPGPFTVTSSYDGDSDSNILIYGEGNAFDWVAYMDGDVKQKRIDWIKSLNFAGTSDWAIDLEYFTGDNPGDDGQGSNTVELQTDIDYLWKLGCDSSMNPGDLQKLLDGASDIPASCRNRFALQILSDMLQQSLSEFQQVGDKKYDSVFGYYAKWVKDSINTQIQDFMTYGTGPGNKYFRCDYQYGNAKGSSSCMGMPHFWEQDVSSVVTYTLVDKAGFYDELASKYGIQQEWIKFGDHEDPYTCADPGDRVPVSGIAHCRKLTHSMRNYPQRVDGDKVKVADPKAVIEASMGNITALRHAMQATRCQFELNLYRNPEDAGSDSDPVVAASMPVFQLASSVDNMKQIKSIGEKVRDEEKKRLILMILGVVLLVIPFVGEGLGSLVGSAAQVARIATVIGEAGNAAVNVAEIIEDPASAPFAILGLLGGIAGGSGKSAEGAAYNKAASARKSIPASKLAKFPPAFRDKDALVQKLAGMCSKN